MTKPIVVLGAGPAGMTAGWRLAELGYPVVVLERDGAVGGMGKTIAIGPYKADFGPHTFHIRATKESEDVIEAIRPFFGPNPVVLSRGTRVLLRGKYYVYPLELVQVLFGLNPLLSARIIFDYVCATIRSLLAPARRENSFEDWGVRSLGRTLYDLCFGIYSARVWGLPTSEISSKQAQRVAKLSLKNVILRTLGIKADPATYFTKYMYPVNGISVLYENMADRMKTCGGQLRLSSEVVRLEREGDAIAAVVYRREGREHTIPCEGVIATLPLPALSTMITPALPATVREHSSKLRYRSMRFVFMVLTRERLADWHWVYLLDKEFTVNRISEQKNVSAVMVPGGETLLCVEISCWKGDDLWNASDDELFRIAFRDVARTGYGVTESEVMMYFVTGTDTAYPVYELNFEDHLFPVLEGVHRMENLLTLGRHGLFLNNSMDDNVLLGIKLGDYVKIHGVKSRPWVDDMLAFMNLRFQGK
ncbi:MAG: FAD-dependent oxidoreductase [Candidatus Rokubacteria bacterium]|nr:FAD-dependent oxidoreductase [Candidatus Rokubacteria bacterium]